MKHIFSLFLLILICQLSLFSQYSKGRFLVEEDLNYWFTSSSNQKNGESKAASLIGYVPYKNWVVGIGLDVIHQRTQKSVNNILLSDLGKNGLSPLIYSKKIFPLSRNLNVALKMQCAYEWLKEKPNVVISSYYIQYYTQYYGGYYSDYSSAILAPTSLTKEFSLLISPEIQFQVTSRLGALVNFNGLEYYDKQYDDESYVIHQHSSDFSLSLKPSNWRLGIFFLIGK